MTVQFKGAMIVVNPSHTCFEFTFANMSPGVLNGGVAVDVREEAKTEALRVVAGVSEAINNDRVSLCMEHLTHPVVQLIVSYTGPVGWFLCEKGSKNSSSIIWMSRN